MGNARKPFGRVLLLSGGAGLILGLLILGFGSSVGTIAQQRETASYEPYSVKHLPASELASRLRDTLTRLHAEAEVVPDPQNKRVLVKGSGVNQRLVSQLIQTLDQPEASSAEQRPVSTRESASTAAPPQARGYTVHEHQLDDVLANLREHFGRQGGVRFAIDQRTKQIIAVAPNELQEKIADKIAELNRALAGSEEPVAAPPAAVAKKDNRGAKTKVVAGQQTQERQLKFARAEEVEERLKSFYGRRLGATVSPDGESAVLAVPVRDGEIASLRLDRRTGQIRMDGSAAALTSLDRLLAALDHGPNAPQVDTELLPLDAKEPERVQRALTLLTAALRSDDAAGQVTAVANRVADLEQVAAEDEGGKPAAPAVKTAPQPAAPATKPALPETPDNSAAAPAAAPGDTGPAMGDGDDDTGLVGAVQIEYIDGLDIIVIRGRKRDVERVTKMIQDIEEISQQTKPVIQVYPLKHTNNQALADLLLQVYDQILSTRQGRVTILPLVKPNSILLIGREESVKTIVELIQKLDQPVSPSAMMKVFPLRNMAAADAELTVRNFFTGVRTGGAATGGAATGGAAGGVAPLGVGGGAGFGAGGANAAQGLGTRVVVVADYRSNSLIVQASPRDLTEVAKLIKEIDVEVSPFTAELRVFKLKNTLAQDTATVLTAAIRGQATAGGAGAGAGGQVGAGQFGQPGGGVGGAAANAASRPESPRSASLQFVTVDGKGKQVLAAGIASDVTVTADVSANSILVRGPSRAMELIAAII
ncbi:MAG: secretin N-terminal domain-containing protein, partial [Planctomycetota bacterium]